MTLLLLWLSCGTEPISEPETDALEYFDAAMVDYHEAFPRRRQKGLNAHYSRILILLCLKIGMRYLVLKSGDLNRALVLYNDALSAHPGSGDLRYNRAAILAKLGKLKEAASDLLILYNNGDATPFEVGRDPDFMPLQLSSTQ